MRYPNGVPHFKNSCTPTVPHFKSFVPHLKIRSWQP
ncbi:unnamed protein product, partial [Rotaria sp. Silwood1]